MKGSVHIPHESPYDINIACESKLTEDVTDESQSNIAPSLKTFSSRNANEGKVSKSYLCLV